MVNARSLALASALLLALAACGGGRGSGDSPTLPPPPPPPSTPSQLKLDLGYINQGSAQFARYRAWAESALSSGLDHLPYAFSALDAVIMYRLTNQEGYRNLALAMVDRQVDDALAVIATGGRPAVSGDSYLEVGPMIADLAATYTWCAPTDAQKTRWKGYADQAIWNVWHPGQAKWGSVSHPWSGWSINNPGNNYYYSFLQATIYWALASNDQATLTFLRQDKWAALLAYYAQLSGGGSREGTGYGTAHMNLFSLYKVWSDSLGEDPANASPHLADTIRYWVHATVPTRDRFAPIGDQARDSSATLYDYHRRLMLEARHLVKGDSYKALASWWLNHISVAQMANGFNFRHDLYPAGTSGDLPVVEGLIHHSAGTGHIFARTGWGTDATWMSFVAGPYTESHAHQDQGAFSLYKQNWKAVTPNILSQSGINQDTTYHNLVRFDRGGEVIRQIPHDVLDPATTSRLSFLHRDDLTGECSLDADLTPAYNGQAGLSMWKRRIDFLNDPSLGGERILDIRDSFLLGAGVQAVFQLHTQHQPTVADNVLTANGLSMTVLEPAGASISVISRSGGEGYTTEVRGGTTGYRVRIRVQ